MAIPESANTVPILSAHDPGRAADTMPTGTEISSAITIAMNASWSVGGRLLAIRKPTSWWL